MKATQPKLRIVIAGCGSLVQQVHLPLLKSMGNVQVVAVADPLDSARHSAAAQIPGLLTFESLSQLLDSVSCDAVIVASPTNLHAEDAALVLSYKKALYLEKPMAATLAEATQLIEVSRSSKTVAMMGFNYRYNPLWQHVAREAKREPLTALETVFSLATREVPRWKQKRATGGGALLDLATHHLDLIMSVFEVKPVSIAARIRSERTEHDSVQIKIISSTGIPITGHYALLGQEADEFTLKTAAGSRRFSRYDPFSFPVFPPHEFVRYHVARWRSPWKEASFAHSLQAWIHAIEHDQPSPIPLQDGLRVMQWVDAAESSAS